MVNKKGYFYIVELLLVVLIITATLIYLPKSEQKHISYEEEENIRSVGYGALYSLDEKGIFDKYFDLNISESNFDALEKNIIDSVPEYRIAKIEYIYNNYTSDGTSFNVVCLNASGNVTACSQFDKKKRELVVSTFYTYFKTSNPITIRLFIKRLTI